MPTYAACFAAFGLEGYKALAGAGALASGAVCSYALALHLCPQRVCFRYCWLDEDGLSYVAGVAQSGRISKYAWNELVSVECTADGEEDQGILLQTSRAKLKGVPLFLRMACREDALDASKAIRIGLSRADSRHEV